MFLKAGNCAEENKCGEMIKNVLKMNIANIYIRIPRKRKVLLHHAVCCLHWSVALPLQSVDPMYAVRSLQIQEKMMLKWWIQ